MYENVAATQAAANTTARSGHSALGITSMVLGIISILVFIFMFLGAIGLAMKAHAHGGAIDTHSSAAIGLGLFVLLTLLLSVVGTCFGIAGVVQKMRKLAFGIAGLCMNGGVLLIVVLLMAVGLANR